MDVNALKHVHVLEGIIQHLISLDTEIIANTYCIEDLPRTLFLKYSHRTDAASNLNSTGIMTNLYLTALIGTCFRRGGLQIERTT